MLGRTIAFLFLLGSCPALLYYYGYYWMPVLWGVSEPPSLDLYGHAEAVRRLVSELDRANFSFYDPLWFGGYPAFHFYSFGPHFLAALVAKITGISAIQSVYTILAIVCSLLPFSVYFLCSAFIDPESERSDLKLILAAWFSITLAFWFLNHDAYRLYIGTIGVFQIGTFSQAFGWHSILIHLGMLARLEKNPHRFLGVFLAFNYGLACVTHNLSFVFISFFSLMLWLSWPKTRGIIFVSHLIGLALAAFWLLPLVVYVREYTVSRFALESLDLIEQALYYELPEILFSLTQLWPVSVNYAYVLVAMLIPLSFFLAAGEENKAFLRYSIITLFFAVLFSSPTFGEGIALGLHLGRLQGYLILLLAGLISFSGVLLFSTIDKRLRGIGLGGLIAFFILFFVNYSIYKTPPRNSYLFTPEQLSASPTRGEELINYFKKEPEVGRVVFERVEDVKQSADNLRAYLRLNSELGIETINGLFIQSSRPYSDTSLIAVGLGMKMIYSRSQLASMPEVSLETRVEQLRDEGVTHLVFNQQEAAARVSEAIRGKVENIEPYMVVRISDSKKALCESIRKEIITYDGSVYSFAWLQSLFSAYGELSRHYEIIEAGAEFKTNSELSDDLPGAFLPESSQLNFPPPKTWRIDHDTRFKNAEPASVPFRRFQFLFDKVLELPRKLLERLEGRQASADVPFQGPSCNWISYGKELKLENLTPGKPVRVNYRYFPLWRAEGGSLYRGTSGYMFIMPEQESVVLRYSPLRNLFKIIGLLISLLACFVILLSIFHRPPQIGKSGG